MQSRLKKGVSKFLSKEVNAVLPIESKLTNRKFLKSIQSLSKAKLTLFNALAGTGGALAGGGVSAAIPTFIGVYGLACTCASINQLQEIKQDSLMNRTKLKRPLCTGTLTPQFAKGFAVSTAIIGSTTLYQFCGPVSLLFGAITVGMYNGVYTPLKQKTVWNTEVGALVGALPPVIGIAGAQFTQATTDLDFSSLLLDTVTDPYALALFSLLYCWQLPHFMAICFWNKKDYTNAGFEMLSKYDADGYYCSRKALAWSVPMATLPFFFYQSGVTTWMYAVDGGALSLGYTYICWKWFRAEDRHKASKAPFVSGLILLPALLFLMTIHSTRLHWLSVENTHLHWLQKVGIHSLPLHECMLPQRNQQDPSDFLPSAPKLLQTTSSSHTKPEEESLIHLTTTATTKI